MIQRLIFLSMLACLLALPNLKAQAQTDADRAFEQCGTITNAASRLACYDSARSVQQSAPANSTQHWSEFSTPSAGAVQPISPPPRAAMAMPAQNHNIVANVAHYTMSSDRKFTVLLDNGQTWKQLNSDDADAQFKEHGANRVVISRGFWKSYDLKLNSMNAVFKVVRVN
jgi:hypothetical protein